jgi:hypothetical protein
MFERAVNRDPPLLDRNPCAAVPEEDRPKKRDANPEWRPTAKFSREEVELLLTSPLVPLDRRVFYAVAFLAGSRFGETAALRVRHYKPGARPLGQLVVARSYSSKKRKVKETKDGHNATRPRSPVVGRDLPWALDRDGVGRDDGPTANGRRHPDSQQAQQPPQQLHHVEAAQR